ncbi:hypothetical protein ACH4SP_04735 [Streptomyces sp. NPDC021093]|uniref:hypothetical protein n=1 Tax=Streptomyces sp. NPDC021093 TaxID=3365112 RepID=UPI0037BB05C3
MCRATSTLPPVLAARALEMAPSGTASDLDPHLVCVLGEHAGPGHWAHACEIEGVRDREVWARWTDERAPYTVLVRPDCPGESPDGAEGCAMFEGHPGPCTWELDDPEGDALQKLFALGRDTGSVLGLILALHELDPPAP